MFINFTNHKSELWSREQRETAEAYGEIVDIPFPAVDPFCDNDKINNIAAEYTSMICGYKPDAVLAQGEMTLCYAVVSSLIGLGIKVLCATTERVSSSHIGENGETVKVSGFRFVRFREYIGFDKLKLLSERPHELQNSNKNK